MNAPSVTEKDSGKRLNRLGIIGNGQLGRMMAVEARRLGIEVTGAGAGDERVMRAFCHNWVAANPEETIEQMAQLCDVVTVEHEHVDPKLLQGLRDRGVAVTPEPAALALIQDKLQQRRWAQGVGLAQPAFMDVPTVESLQAARERFGDRFVVKARRGGYDGKGTLMVEADKNWSTACALVTDTSCLAEAFIPFDKEVSALAARDRKGAISTYEVVENIHENNTLSLSVAPARVSADVAAQAQELARRIASELGHVGVLAAELFLSADGTLRLNEIAPRVHNSGHFTLGACKTSQFAQHVRAACGWALGSVEQKEPAAMLNLYSDSWLDGGFDWAPLRDAPDVHVHLYEKAPDRPGRKVGHLLATGPTLHEAVERMRNSCEAAGINPPAFDRLGAV